MTGKEEMIRARIKNLASSGAQVCNQFVKPFYDGNSCAKCTYSAEIHLLRDAINVIDELKKQND